jgi:hypothetical protein
MTQHMSKHLELSLTPDTQLPLPIFPGFLWLTCPALPQFNDISPHLGKESAV